MGNLEYRACAHSTAASVRRQYSLTLSLSTQILRAMLRSVPIASTPFRSSSMRGMVHFRLVFSRPARADTTTLRGGTVSRSVGSEEHENCQPLGAECGVGRSRQSLLAGWNVAAKSRPYGCAQRHKEVELGLLGGHPHRRIQRMGASRAFRRARLGPARRDWTKKQSEASVNSVIES